jgi:hypothetical protein
MLPPSEGRDGRRVQGSWSSRRGRLVILSVIPSAVTRPNGS